MYLALQPLSLRQPDCTVATVAPGQEVPGFTDWPIWTQQAMLQQHQVRWAPEGLAPHEKPENQRVVHQPLPSRVLGPPDKPAVVEVGPELYVPGARGGADAQDDSYQDLVVDSEAKPVRKRGRKPAPAPADAPAEAAAPTVTESTIQEVASRQAPDGVVAYATPPAGKGAHDCPACERTGFKDFNGLRIHMAKAHPSKD